MTDDEIQFKFREMSREISNLKRKAGVAHDKRVIAEARSHENKMRAKTAEYGLRHLSQKYQRAVQTNARLEKLLRRWQADSTEDYSLSLDTERELADPNAEPSA